MTEALTTNSYKDQADPTSLLLVTMVLIAAAFAAVLFFSHEVSPADNNGQDEGATNINVRIPALETDSVNGNQASD